jgi:hypothetical protein
LNGIQKPDYFVRFGQFYSYKTKKRKKTVGSTNGPDFGIQMLIVFENLWKLDGNQKLGNFFENLTVLDLSTGLVFRR